MNKVAEKTARKKKRKSEKNCMFQPKNGTKSDHKKSNGKEIKTCPTVKAHIIEKSRNKTKNNVEVCPLLQTNSAVAVGKIQRKRGVGALFFSPRTTNMENRYCLKTKVVSDATGVYLEANMRFIEGKTEKSRFSRPSEVAYDKWNTKGEMLPAVTCWFLMKMNEGSWG